ncbi:MAG: hypothetical protein KKC75_00360 [Nanoarchaeota archaeon]|nr:hypothetical protein [Nanoarchaeota archaeon]MBU1945948.1 hypothetical protein [Nanoarchaeota archaeon]
MSANNIQFTKVEIQILKFIFKHFKDRFNARQISKILSLNHAHTNKLCSGLYKKKLLLKEKIGNSIYYRFDYSNVLTIKFMEYLLSLEYQESPKWLSVLIYNLNKFNKLIELGCIFGSSIKSSSYNDIDVLLVYKKNNSSKINKIKDEIRKAGLMDKPIRYVDMTEKDILNNKGDKVIYNILSENIIFYNPNKYVKVIKWLR